jgi:hypothetical protein
MHEFDFVLNFPHHFRAAFDTSYLFDTGNPCLKIKQPARGGNLLSLTNVEVKNLWSYTSTPLHAFTAWLLGKRKMNFQQFGLCV